MALSTCRECRKTVSTEAHTCPNCGAPNPVVVRERREGEAASLRKPILLLVAIFVGIASFGIIADHLRPPEDSAPARATAPVTEEARYYSADLTGALEHWLAGDRPITIVKAHDDIDRFAIWKTSDGRPVEDDGPSLAPLVRARVPAGTELMLLAGPIDTRMKVTNGEWVGWIGEVQLDSVPAIY